MHAQPDERYDQLIADYLDGKMTEEEEVAFMAEVSANAELRQRYEQQIDLGWQLQTEEEPAEQPASIRPAAPPAPIPPTTLRWQYWAAAAVLVLGAATYWLLTKPAPQTDPIAKTNTDTPAAAPNVVSTPPDSAATPNLFTRYYQRYAGSDRDPLVLSVVLQQYQQGKHQLVTDARPEDFQLMGSTTEEEQTSLYLRLYKALSQLDKGEPAAAAELKQLAGQRMSPHVAATATWYAALAYLQQSDNAACQALLLQGSQLPDWPYKAKAEQLLSALSAPNQ